MIVFIIHIIDFIKKKFNGLINSITSANSNVNTKYSSLYSRQNIYKLSNVSKTTIELTSDTTPKDVYEFDILYGFALAYNSFFVIPTADKIIFFNSEQYNYSGKTVYGYGYLNIDFINKSYYNYGFQSPMTGGVLRYQPKRHKYAQVTNACIFLQFNSNVFRAFDIRLGKNKSELPYSSREYGTSWNSVIMPRVFQNTNQYPYFIYSTRVIYFSEMGTENNLLPSSRTVTYAFDNPNIASGIAIIYISSNTMYFFKSTATSSDYPTIRICKIVGSTYTTVANDVPIGTVDYYSEQPYGLNWSQIPRYYDGYLYTYGGTTKVNINTGVSTTIQTYYGHEDTTFNANKRWYRGLSHKVNGGEYWYDFGYNDSEGKMLLTTRYNNSGDKTLFDYFINIK